VRVFQKLLLLTNLHLLFVLCNSYADDQGSNFIYSSVSQEVFLKKTITEQIINYNLVQDYLLNYDKYKIGGMINVNMDLGANTNSVFSSMSAYAELSHNIDPIYFDVGLNAFYKLLNTDFGIGPVISFKYRLDPFLFDLRASGLFYVCTKVGSGNLTFAINQFVVENITTTLKMHLNLSKQGIDSVLGTYMLSFENNDITYKVGGSISFVYNYYFLPGLLFSVGGVKFL
jgi:hypothetical protein